MWKTGRFSAYTDPFLSLSIRAYENLISSQIRPLTPLIDTTGVCIIRFISKIFRTHHNQMALCHSYVKPLTKYYGDHAKSQHDHSHVEYYIQLCVMLGILTWTLRSYIGPRPVTPNHEFIAENQQTNRSGFPEYFHIREIRPTEPFPLVWCF